VYFSSIFHAHPYRLSRLLDRRAEHSGLIDLMKLYGVKLLAFGAVAGGWLSDVWYDKEDPLRSRVSYIFIHISQCVSGKCVEDVYVVCIQDVL